jgi:hypothetical protein
MVLLILCLEHLSPTIKVVWKAILDKVVIPFGLELNPIGSSPFSLAPIAYFFYVHYITVTRFDSLELRMNINRS